MPVISRRAEKDLAELPPQLREKAESLISRLDQEPSLGKKLLGKLAGLRSARLGRSHRVVYQVAKGGVEVIAVRPRKDAYG